MTEFMQVIFGILPYFWTAVYAALSVLSFLRLRRTAGGIILGTGFAVHALVFLLRAAFNLGFDLIIPTLLDILILVGIALIPRSLKRLARTPGAAAARY
jgi:hypothetical protein